MIRNQGRILVIRGGAIGDFILTLPVFAALRERFPQTQLDVLGYPHIARLALKGGLVDRLQSIEARALAGFFARSGSLDPQLSEFFAGCSVVISYLYDPDGIFQTNVGRSSKAQFIAGPHRPDEKLNLHATEVFLKALERLAIFGADSVPRLIIPADGTVQPQSKAGEPNEVCLAVHPGSGSERKNWPVVNWASLLERLVTQTQWRFVLIGGEVEGERIERLARLLPVERVSIAQSLPLEELAAHLQRCAAFIGHDSGISHLAAAVGIRGLVLWGETNPAIWRPRNDRMDLIQSEGGLDHLDVETVFEALMRLRPGNP